MKILVVEDEKGMAQALRRGLEEEKHVVSLAHEGVAALSLAQQVQFDLVLLDVMLPGMNGIQIASRLRETRRDIPILMLTARDAVPDVVRGLDAGADDYLTKPFSFAVLLARIRALERRAVEPGIRTLRVSDLALDIQKRCVHRGSREIQLTPTEFRLLEFLMRRAGSVATRPAILEAVWKPADNVEENTLDAFVRLLRRKIDENEPVKLIHTVRGLGYSLGSEPRP
jgi:two-component system copper resistance phosphate regulon response regulator CusR